MSKKYQVLLGLVLMLVIYPNTTFAMHIMEGFLPPGWAIAWGCFAFLLL